MATSESSAAKSNSCQVAGSGIICLLCNTSISETDLSGHIFSDHFSFKPFSCTCCEFCGASEAAVLQHAAAVGHIQYAADRTHSKPYLSRLVKFILNHCHSFGASNNFAQLLSDFDAQLAGTSTTNKAIPARPTLDLGTPQPELVRASNHASSSRCSSVSIVYPNATPDTTTSEHGNAASTSHQMDASAFEEQMIVAFVKEETDHLSNSAEMRQQEDLPLEGGPTASFHAANSDVEEALCRLCNRFVSEKRKHVRREHMTGLKRYACTACGGENMSRIALERSCASLHSISDGDIQQRVGTDSHYTQQHNLCFGLDSDHISVARTESANDLIRNMLDQKKTDFPYNFSGIQDQDMGGNSPVILTKRRPTSGTNSGAKCEVSCFLCERTMGRGNEARHVWSFHMDRVRRYSCGVCKRKNTRLAELTAQCVNRHPDIVPVVQDCLQSDDPAALEVKDKYCEMYGLCFGRVPCFSERRFLTDDRGLLEGEGFAMKSDNKPNSSDFALSLDNACFSNE